MAVSVFIAATLRRFFSDYNPQEGILLDVPKGTTVFEVLHRLGIPPSEVKVIMVNGVHSPLDRSLKGHERIGLFPAVGGG